LLQRPVLNQNPLFGRICMLRGCVTQSRLYGFSCIDFRTSVLATSNLLELPPGLLSGLHIRAWSLPIDDGCYCSPSLFVARRCSRGFCLESETPLQRSRLSQTVVWVWTCAVHPISITFVVCALRDWSLARGVIAYCLPTRTLQRRLTICNMQTIHVQINCVRMNTTIKRTK